MLLPLLWLTSKPNPYSTYSWITRSRKGQNLHGSHCAKYKHEKVHTPRNISLIIDARVKAQLICFSQRIVQGAWVISHHDSQLFPCITECYDKCGQHCAKTERCTRAESIWLSPFCHIMSLDYFSFTSLWVNCNLHFQAIDKRQETALAKDLTLVMSLTRSYGFCTLLVLKLKYSREKQVKYQEPHISTATISK